MNYKKHLKGGEPGHYPRYELSAQWLEPLFVPGANVAELGGESPFRDLLRECFPWVNLFAVGELPGDLRESFGELPPMDVVLAMEVIEHMKDRPGDDRTAFTYSGIKNLLSESLRILKPSGKFFLTTPNLAAYGCLWSHASGDCPQFFKPHVRELGPLELKWLIGDAGFSIERFEGIDVWPAGGCPERLAAIVRQLSPDIPRESCLFTLSVKP